MSALSTNFPSASCNVSSTNSTSVAIPRCHLSPVTAMISRECSILAACLATSHLKSNNSSYCKQDCTQQMLHLWLRQARPPPQASLVLMALLGPQTLELRQRCQALTGAGRPQVSHHALLTCSHLSLYHSRFLYHSSFAGRSLAAYCCHMPQHCRTLSWCDRGRLITCLWLVG